MDGHSIGFFAAIAPLSTDMYLPSLPALVEDLQSSTSVAQLTLTANLLGLGLGQLWLGTMSDQRGRRIPLIISLAVYCLASFLCTIAPTIELLIILRFIQGVSGAGGMVISRAIVRDLYSGSELTKFFALLMLINGAGPILAPVIGGQLLQFTSWRGIFVVLGILGMLMIVGAIFSIQGNSFTRKPDCRGIKEYTPYFKKPSSRPYIHGICIYTRVCHCSDVCLYFRISVCYTKYLRSLSTDV